MAKKRKRWKLTKANLAEGDGLLRDVGRVVVTLAHIESTLGWIFGLLNKPTAVEKSGEYFHSLQTFERRLNLLNFTIEKQCSADDIRKWKKIYNGIGQHRKSRNQVAHRGMSYVWDHDDNFIGAFLQPPMYRRGGPETKISRTEVQKAADALTSINVELWNFAMELPEPS